MRRIDDLESPELPTFGSIVVTMPARIAFAGIKKHLIGGVKDTGFMDVLPMGVDA